MLLEYFPEVYMSNLVATLYVGKFMGWEFTVFAGTSREEKFKVNTAAAAQEILGKYERGVVEGYARFLLPNGAVTSRGYTLDAVQGEPVYGIECKCENVDWFYGEAPDESTLENHRCSYCSQH